MTATKRKCPRCAWTGTWVQFMKHYRTHYKGKKSAAVKKGGNWKKPPYARVKK